ncbi:uncharacterized protein LOC119307648 [Triticum dicoccoides]|uniref:uncharacterized protein LOC119307648 n=1 Tax=Triticum dicoccoides TaxID=85692 RepID=UPI00188F7E0F|nr:uncharacterized protein LOC119307648 [Triticum dicoccoides]
MPISAGIRAPPQGASVYVPGSRILRVPVPQLAAGGVRRRRLGVVVAAASSAASPDELHARGRHLHGFPEKSLLWNLIKDVEPLDLSVVQRDVPPETVDAMKRTVSGMLGLLPSDQFRVVVEALWDPFFKLVISSIKTGYTLSNAEYRLSLERILELSDDETECKERDSTEYSQGSILRLSEDDEAANESEKRDGNLLSENMGGLDSLNAQAKEHILQLQSRLDSMERELHELKKKNSSLQMQQFAGEEKNELLDYLRSLSPDTVIELSEPSCPGVQEAIHSVVHGLLATLSPKMHAKPPPPSENMAGGTLNYGNGDDDRAELVEDVSLPFQPLISIPRDHLARLLFWCMLLGHYIRGLERRLELSQLLEMSSDTRL